ncbi:MAG: peptidylprolyl isomerase [Lachnospiraceae bacterium]
MKIKIGNVFAKKIVVVLLAVLCCVSLTGCEKKQKNLFHICGQDLSYEETLVFGYIYGMTYNLKMSDSFNEIYEGDMDYGTYCKNQIQQDIVHTMLLYHEAKQEKMTLSSDKKKEVSDNAEKLIAYFGKDVFEGGNIEKSDITTVYEMKAYAEEYVNRKLTVEETGETGDSYVRVYQVTFLTAKLNDNGNYDLDENGNVIMMDSAFCNEKKEEAEEFFDKVSEGTAIKSLVKEYDDSVIGVEKYLNYNDLSDSYKKAVDELSVGETSKPFSFGYGYYVVQLLSKDGAEYKDAVLEHDRATKSEELKEKELQRLKEKYIGTATDYIEEDWDLIKIETFVK